MAQVLEKIVDYFDEVRVQNGLKSKPEEAYDLGAEFYDCGNIKNLEDACLFGTASSGKVTFFSDLVDTCTTVSEDEFHLKFHSGVQTKLPENNCVKATYSKAKNERATIIVFHHWNAAKKKKSLDWYFSTHGISTIQVSMPYHFERSLTSTSQTNNMLSANIGLTVQSVRQAVVDGITLCKWLNQGGQQNIYLLGMSLGSWVAALVAASEPSVQKASLFLTGGSFADFVWTGRATSKIRSGFEGNVTQAQLNKAWDMYNLNNYVDLLSRKDLDLQVLLARRDTVVRSEVSMVFTDRLREHSSNMELAQFNCGHYSLGKPPFVFGSLSRLKNFLI